MAAGWGKRGGGVFMGKEINIYLKKNMPGVVFTATQKEQMDEYKITKQFYCF